MDTQTQNEDISFYLDIADGIHPASPLGGTVGLERVGGHSVFELIEVDEDERTCRRK